MKIKIYPVLIAIFFFISLILTIKDYNISWDETIHFRRGQAYLYYFLTGKKDYSNLSSYNLQGTNGDPQKVPLPRRSLFQSDYHNGQWFLSLDNGHPPLSDDLSSVFNYIFYQRLGILPDIFSYHLFNAVCAALLIFAITYFTLKKFGIFVSIISSLSLSLYPLFFSEAHFNIKDPVETAFFTCAVISLVWLFENFNLKWLILAILSLTLAIGTKLNIVFLIFILGPYLLIRYKPWRIKKLNKKKALIVFLTTFLPPVFVILAWPFVLLHFPSGVLKIFTYYENIGLGTQYQPSNFFIFGFNSFPALWIIFTTPLLILILSVIGLISAIQNYNKFDYIPTLLVLWFIVPILRVSLPGASIYGGVRQIMEFLPAMAILSGLGAWHVAKIFNSFNKKFIYGVLIILFIFPLRTIIQYHPNENVYFNILIGGLKGAQARNFPSWGDSFGNAYLTGIKWLNINAEMGGRVTLIQGTASNAPIEFFRPDLNVNNDNFSGQDKKGEYIMELTFNNTTKTPADKWNYVENNLVPVFQDLVDGVAILKIWKNDTAHSRS